MFTGIKTFFSQLLQKETPMAKAEVVQAQMTAIQAAESAALQAGLEACYDQGVADAGVPAPVAGAFTQGDIDAAVAAAKAADAQAMSDAVAAVQAQLDAETAKDAADVAALAAVQAKLDQIKALLG